MRTVLFDFDFTLADSLTGITACARYALTEMDRLPPSTEAVRRTVGLSLLRSAEELGGFTERSDQERYRTLFLEHAARVMTDSTAFYEGVPEMLEELRGIGMTLGIVSTKTRERIVDILTRHRMTHLFATVVGGDEVEEPKPHPAALHLALKRLDANPADTFYVGDHILDGEAAQAAGIPFIAVLTGIHDEQTFRPLHPRAIVGTVCELPRHLAPG